MAKRVTKKASRQELALSPESTVQIPLPVIEALQSAEQGFFELCIETGQQVLAAMLEADRTAACGEVGRHDESRRAVRGGSTESSVVLGGRKVAIRRPRARRVDGGELSLPTMQWASQSDPLDAQAMRAMAAGVSTRRYSRSLEATPASVVERSTSKSAVSRRFVALSEAKLGELFSLSLADLDLAVVMIDGIHFRDHCVLIALGIDSEGQKHPLGLREGSTENAAVAKALLRDLIDRGLPSDRSLVFVIDGGKALRSAIEKTFGPLALVQRCVVHKARNVREHLPKSMHASVTNAMEQAWSSSSAEKAKQRLTRLASSLEANHPGAAASLREGLDETLTLLSVGLDGALLRTLRSTNPIENLNGSVAAYCRNVKRWRGGAMIQRWVGAAVADAQRGFRRVRGYKQMPKLIAALRRREAELGFHSEVDAA